MVRIIYIGISIAYMLMGIFLLFKRNSKVSQVPFGLLHFSVILLNFFVAFNRNEHLGIFIFSIILIVLILLIHQRKYIIFGLSLNTVVEILKNILNEEGISYYEEEGSLKLKDYEDKSIFYRKSWNSVEITLKEIRDLTFYETIKNKLKIKTQEIDEGLFPTNGVFYLISGIGLMALILFLENMTRR
jgi:hypothetical protein